LPDNLTARLPTKKLFDVLKIMLAEGELDVPLFPAETGVVWETFE
jgi:hypothetical protein